MPYRTCSLLFSCMTDTWHSFGTQEQTQLQSLQQTVTTAPAQKGRHKLQTLQQTLGTAPAQEGRGSCRAYSRQCMGISATGFGCSLKHSSLAVNPGQHVGIGTLQPAALVLIPAVLFFNSSQQVAQLRGSLEDRQDLYCRHAAECVHRTFRWLQTVMTPWKAAVDSCQARSVLS